MVVSLGVVAPGNRLWVGAGRAVCGLHGSVVPFLLLFPFGGKGWGLAPAGVWARSLVENCTVDASIFEIVFVVKFLSAQGGCLGTRSRRRTWQPAISLGELASEP